MVPLRDLYWSLRRVQKQLAKSGSLYTDTRSSAGTNEASETESVDVAIADALKSQKNRQTGRVNLQISHTMKHVSCGKMIGASSSLLSGAVLRFEEDVVGFIEGTDDALYFPLTLSGYQVRHRKVISSLCHRYWS